MKRIYQLLICALLAVSLFACANTDEGASIESEALANSAPDTSEYDNPLNVPEDVLREYEEKFDPVHDPGEPDELPGVAATVALSAAVEAVNTTVDFINVFNELSNNSFAIELANITGRELHSMEVWDIHGRSIHNEAENDVSPHDPDSTGVHGYHGTVFDRGNVNFLDSPPRGVMTYKMKNGSVHFGKKLVLYWEHHPGVSGYHYSWMGFTDVDVPIDHNLYNAAWYAARKQYDGKPHWYSALPPLYFSTGHIETDIVMTQGDQAKIKFELYDNRLAYN